MSVHIKEYVDGSKLGQRYRYTMRIAAIVHLAFAFCICVPNVLLRRVDVAALFGTALMVIFSTLGVILRFAPRPRSRRYELYDDHLCILVQDQPACSIPIFNACWYFGQASREHPAMGDRRCIILAFHEDTTRFAVGWDAAKREEWKQALTYVGVPERKIRRASRPFRFICECFVASALGVLCFFFLLAAQNVFRPNAWAGWSSALISLWLTLFIVAFRNRKAIAPPHRIRAALHLSVSGAVLSAAIGVVTGIHFTLTLVGTAVTLLVSYVGTAEMFRAEESAEEGRREER